MDPIYEIELEDCPFCGGPGVMQEENGWCVYVECPDCHKKIKIFGESHIDRIGEEFNLPVLAKMPIDPQLAQLCDEGEIEKAQADYLTEACQKIVEYCDKED